MLTQKQINEIRSHLEKAQNPVFFFDNDQDGLCSFLLLQRFIGRGKGVPIKSFPELTAEYFRRVEELNADYIFVLDKHAAEENFFEKAEQINIPVVWIDHHKTEMKIPNFVSYYNPILNKDKTNEPVTSLCYQITGRKEDLWLAVVGCVSESFVPDFYDEFQKEYPELSADVKNSGDYSEGALEIYYNSQIGKISQIFGAGLKDKTTNVIMMLKFLMKVKSPYDILEESNKNYAMHSRFKDIEKKYKSLLSKAIKEIDREKILFFKYGGDMSISSDLANGMRQKFPDKIVVAGYVSGSKMNISVRGKNVKEKVLEVIKNFEGATGGGHDDAVGVKIKTEDWEKFKEKLGERV